MGAHLFLLLLDKCPIVRHRGVVGGEVAAADWKVGDSNLGRGEPIFTRDMDASRWLGKGWSIRGGGDWTGVVKQSDDVAAHSKGCALCCGRGSMLGKGNLFNFYTEQFSLT